MVCRYDSIYVFGYENMRNERFKEFRESLKEQGRWAQLEPLHDCTDAVAGPQRGLCYECAFRQPGVMQVLPGFEQGHAGGFGQGCRDRGAGRPVRAGIPDPRKRGAAVHQHATAEGAHAQTCPTAYRIKLAGQSRDCMGSGVPASPESSYECGFSGNTSIVPPFPALQQHSAVYMLARATLLSPLNFIVASDVGLQRGGLMSRAQLASQSLTRISLLAASCFPCACTAARQPVHLHMHHSRHDGPAGTL